MADEKGSASVTISLSAPQTRKTLQSMSKRLENAKRMLSEQRRQVEAFVEEQMRKRALRGFN